MNTFELSEHEAKLQKVCTIKLCLLVSRVSVTGKKPKRVTTQQPSNPTESRAPPASDGWGEASERGLAHIPLRKRERL